MTRYLLDTGIAADYLSKRNGVFEQARGKRATGNPIGIGMPVLAELVYGIENSASRTRNMQLLESALPTLKLWPFDKPAAFAYGRLQAELLRNGRPMQSIDIMIAAIALTLGKCVIVSKDSDLSAVPGLAVENWIS
ncbi:MAG: type II toxin-antitoxin system VapC family toxin [Candidatus Acidiferrum sp.]